VGGPNLITKIVHHLDLNQKNRSWRAQRKVHKKKDNSNKVWTKKNYEKEKVGWFLKCITKKTTTIRFKWKKKPRKGVGGFTPRNLHIHHSHLKEKKNTNTNKINWTWNLSFKQRARVAKGVVKFDDEKHHNSKVWIYKF